MKLIYSAASPFVRKVNVMIHEVGLREQVTLSSVQTTALNTSPDARAANPLGKIPALILDDGRTLIDSRVICRFLNDLSGANLYPSDQLWEVLTLEALADGIMESGVSMVYEARLRPEAQQSADWVAAQWDKISHALKALEARGFTALDGNLNERARELHARELLLLVLELGRRSGEDARVRDVARNSNRTS